MTESAQSSRFVPADAEPRVLARWASSGMAHPVAEGTAQENFSIAVPPPNVTGALHMGHALNGSVQDVLVRLNRMRGRRTKWTLGTDHAGIALQAQVEKLLATEGTTRAEIGREAFAERAWAWREQYGSTIIDQFRRMGASADFEDERFTLDPSYVQAVQKVFVELFEQGLIYRDNYMVNWDPGSRSAISDLEVEEREVEDRLYSIAYRLASGDGTLTIATVRPETLLGDSAIAVHPDDERYAHLVGQEAILPIVGRRLPIIADPYVKPEFGTGALKITPAHDPNDFDIGRAHGLAELQVIGEDGRMTEATGPEFAGMTALDCREAIVERLRGDGSLVAEEPYVHAVPFSHRSGERIEPLVSLQWFMRMDELAAPAIEALQDGRVRMHPERWTRVTSEWLQGIRPWCVSRQLWWGHQIPVWYRGEETYVGTQAPEGDGWVRDPDVLDTWFSSALWPFATLGWPETTAELRAFYPTHLVSTARDILFLWVARMVMMGLRFAGDVPFSDVYVHSTILARDGRRMSKSLGTGIDPIELIDERGADAVRFGLLAMSSTQDVRFSDEKILQGQNLTNKLWNASRLILMRLPDGATVGGPTPTPVAPEDRWILSRLQATQKATVEAIDTYEFHRAALGLYDFVFGELCDWYLELVKPRLYSEPEAVAPVALHVLEQTLALAHPIIPFVTEELWSLLPGAEGLMAEHPFPEHDDALVDPDAEALVSRAIGAVQALRGWRDRVGAAPGREIPAHLEAPGLEPVAEHIGRLARIAWTRQEDPPIATVVVDGGVVSVYASDAVDLEAEAKRVEAKRATLGEEIARAEGKLANERFVGRAPAAVVQAERDKLAALQAELAELG